MKIPLRSVVTMHGRSMAGARSLWRANGMKEEQFGKPVIAIVNSFSQFVPGHVHLHETGQYIKRIIEEEGCFAAEFNTIAIDDGIAMGHEGMLYSLPSRELIADSVEYMVNAHRADAMICISNCDKITPGMLMAAMRLNIPAVFVSGGPMEAGVLGSQHYDLIDAMVMAADPSVTDEMLAEVERIACPTCGCCSGMFTANSMNCLTEALGFAMPGNGTLVSTHSNRLLLIENAARLIVHNAFRYYGEGDTSVLPRSIGNRPAFLNAMALDLAMGGSTNTVLHLLAVAREAQVDFTMRDVDHLSRQVPTLCKVAPSSHFHVEDVNRAGGVISIMAELTGIHVLDETVKRVDGFTLGEAIRRFSLLSDSVSGEALNIYRSAPGRHRTLKGFSQSEYYHMLDTDRVSGCIRSIKHAYHTDGGLAVLTGNIAANGCVVKTAGVDAGMFRFEGTACVYESQEDACRGILDGEVNAGDVVVIRYEGPKGGPGMQEMLYPTSWLKSRKLDKQTALITDGRFSGGTSGLSLGHISPEAAAGGNIALVRNGDTIEIDIPKRSIRMLVPDEELSRRKEEEMKRGAHAFTPLRRERIISPALKAYARFVSSADTGGVRIVE